MFFSTWIETALQDGEVKRHSELCQHSRGPEYTHDVYEYCLIPHVSTSITPVFDLAHPVLATKNCPGE